MAHKRLIICNTSPLINLAETGLLDLLGVLLGAACIPPAVQEELRSKDGLFPKAAKAADSGRFVILPPGDNLLVRGFSATLHRGEAECLTLAMENPGSLLVIDDLSARSVAAANGLPFTGTLGILTAAKARGHLAALAPVLGELRSRARFWINTQLEQEILVEAGERECG